VNAAAGAAPGAGLRAQAARSLVAVLGQGRSLKAELAGVLPGIADGRDRALLEAICFSVLRHYRRYSFVLDAWMQRPLRERDAEVRCLLLAGLAQIDALQLSAHAAVGATAEAARVLGRAAQVGFVNALLRRALREAWPQSEQPGVQHSHPDWLVQALAQAWPQEHEAILRAGNEPAPMWLAVNPRQASRADYLAQLHAACVDASAPEWPSGALRLATPRSPETLPGWSEGAVWVQDGAAQLAVEALAPVTGAAVLDACAAPGGKTAQLAAALGEQGSLLAVDIDARRMRRVAATLARLRLQSPRIELLAADATQADFAGARRFDAILLDAPCSATGIIRRQPDIKWHRRASDIAAAGAAAGAPARRAVAAARARRPLSLCHLLAAAGRERAAGGKLPGAHALGARTAAGRALRPRKRTGGASDCRAKTAWTVSTTRCSSAMTERFIDAAQSGRERRELLWLFALALLALGAGYGLRDPWPADEPRFVLVAKQMLESGQWLFPHRGIELYPDKPPLFFWLLAACKSLLGSWRWSFLLPSLLSGLGVLWLVYDLGRRLWSHRSGLWAAIAVLTALQFIYQFKRAQIDPTLVLATTLSLYGLCRHLLLGPDWRWYWAACFCAGLGVILKGVGFLPLLVLLPWALMRRSGCAGWRGWAMATRCAEPGALAFLGAIALWLGSDAVFRPRRRRSRASRLPRQPAVQADRHALRRCLAPQQALLVFRRRGAGLLAAVLAGLLLAVARLGARLARARCAQLAAAGLGAAGAAVLQPQPGQARHVHPAGIAGGRACRRAFPAGAARARRVPPRDCTGWRWCCRSGCSRSACLRCCSRRRRCWRWCASADSAPRRAGCGGCWPRSARSASARRWRGGAKDCARSARYCSRYAWATAFVAYPVLDPSSSARAIMQRARELAGPAGHDRLVRWKEQNLLQAVDRRSNSDTAAMPPGNCAPPAPGSTPTRRTGACSFRSPAGDRTAWWRARRCA
jgi:16S rRNA (cytosine967-C5)-methyltransferase